MAVKVLYLTAKELGLIVLEELRVLKRLGVTTEEELREYFSEMFRELLDEYGVDGLVVKGRLQSDVDFIFNEGSFILRIERLFGKRGLVDLLNIKLSKDEGVERGRGFSFLERLAMRFGMGRMDEVIRKCRKKDKRSADDVWCVYSEKGRLLGRAKTKEDALRRLRQVEYFKHKKGGR
jgi:sugar-specific transcriptional regulator TrmB